MLHTILLLLLAPAAVFAVMLVLRYLHWISGAVLLGMVVWALVLG